MELKETWRGLILILFIGIVTGVLNVLFFIYVMNPLTIGSSTDEVAANTYALNLFVGWVFFSAWFLARADDELKNVEMAIHKEDLELFLLEAPKRIALSIRILYLIISALVVLSFHIFHMQNLLITCEIQFGIGFLVVITVLVLLDLDSPIGGAITVSGVPEEWMQALRQKEHALKHGYRIPRVAAKIEVADPEETTAS